MPTSMASVSARRDGACQRTSSDTAGITMPSAMTTRSNGISIAKRKKSSVASCISSKKRE
jgi:hypothetical protein